jgi:hypothetical protein
VSSLMPKRLLTFTPNEMCARRMLRTECCMCMLFVYLCIYYNDLLLYFSTPNEGGWSVADQTSYCPALNTQLYTVQPWFFQSLGRHDAEETMKRAGLVDGCVCVCLFINLLLSFL